MSKRIVIAGGGAAGIAAAIYASSKNIETILIESDGFVGGELCTGMPILGTYSAFGKQCVGGVLDEIIQICQENKQQYIGPVCDWRTLYGLCLNPEVLRLAINTLLIKYKTKVLVNARVMEAASQAGRLQSVTVLSKNGTKQKVDCDFLIDATGSGLIAQMCGAKVFSGDEHNVFQPISLIFRMAGVNFEEALRFIRDNPEEALLAENPILGTSQAKAAIALYNKGLPYYALASSGSLLGNAIESKEMFPCTAVFITPTSINNKEVCLNSTRIAGINCLDETQVANSLTELYEQVGKTERFLQNHVPGFENACLSAIASRIGIRETSRIAGEYTLTQSDVVDAVKHKDAVARGCHHVDIHGAGVEQVRIPVKGDGVYDIPIGSLIPKGIKNVLVAGRCLSSDRGANGSARVMGTCIDMGQAASKIILAAISQNLSDTRDVNMEKVNRDCE